MVVMDPQYPLPAADPAPTSTWPTAPSLMIDAGPGVDNIIWRPHSSLDEALAEIVAKAVCDCNYHHLFPPRTGETFGNPDAAYERLQNWAMSRGFAVVLRSKEAGNAARGTPLRVRWMCIHHGSETANKRGLEEHVERDSPLLL
jgi:hypothetical protein